MEDPASNPFVTEPQLTPPSHSPALSRTPSQASSGARLSSDLTTASTSPPPTQRATFPDPSKEPRRGASRLSGPKVKEDFCCERDRQIARGDEISIVDAVKTSDGGKSSYITYVIQLGTSVSRRRYSHFLQLHQALQGLYPVLIIPPIPSKQSITDYAVKGQSKTKEDAATIAKRKRLFEDFLRRLARHPILGGEHVFHRFLDPNASWSEVLNSAPLSLLPKNPLHAPSHNPTFQDSDEAESGSTSGTSSYIAHHLLPTPSPNHPLHRPDQRFFESESFTDKFQQHFQGTMEKVNRRVAKRWGEHAADMSELGAQWNGFSLTDQGPLGPAIEKVGQAVDADYLATTQLLKSWEVNATEPLHTYTQFAQLIRSRLSFRHRKHVQYELVQEALENQRDKLELLEAAEREARRLEEALERGGNMSASTTPTSPDQNAPPPEPSSPRPSPTRRGQSFGLLSAVKHSLSGMMDVDPEATRRANIAKTRDNISQLEDSLQASAQDLKYASTTLQADLDRFQRQKVADLRQLAIQLSLIHREWCRQNLEAWKAAQTTIRDIPNHPNTAPPGSEHEASSSTPADDASGSTSTLRQTQPQSPTRGLQSPQRSVHSPQHSVTSPQQSISSPQLSSPQRGLSASMDRELPPVPTGSEPLTSPSRMGGYEPESPFKQDPTEQMGDLKLSDSPEENGQAGQASDTKGSKSSIESPLGPL